MPARILGHRGVDQGGQAHARDQLLVRPEHQLRSDSQFERATDLSAQESCYPLQPRLHFGVTALRIEARIEKLGARQVGRNAYIGNGDTANTRIADFTPQQFTHDALQLTLDAPAAMRIARHGTLPPGLLQRADHFDAREALDLVADPHVVVVLHPDTAFGSGAHFVDVFLEAAQRFERAFEDHDVIAQHADRVIATHVAVHHHAASHRAELAGTEHFAHFREPDDLLLDLRSEHARHDLPDVIDGFVDDAVVTHIDVAFLDRIASRCIRAHVESDDARLRGRSQRHVRLGEPANTAEDDLHGDL